MHPDPAEPENVSKSSQAARWRLAEEQLRRILDSAGWKLKAIARHGRSQGDLRARRGKIEYAIELKAASEGRGDRLIPLFAQAVLQLNRGSGKAMPLPVVSAPRIGRQAANQVVEFAREYAPEVALGLFDYEGFRLFRGPGLDSLNAEPGMLPPSGPSGTLRESRNLFSDLNQWMLKVLLAPELPEHLLSAPRGRYVNVSQLARAARVSVMSAFRFVQRLKDDGYLHESPRALALVRRDDLLARWQASADGGAREIAMRFILPGQPDEQLHKLLRDRSRACLALFAAAEALKLGFVHGVPPYVYVERLQPSSISAWKGLRACEAGEPPDVMLRQAPAPQSVFRGMVRVGEVAVCDVLQVWLDVGSHPARGREQADLIRQRVLDPVIRSDA